MDGSRLKIPAKLKRPKLEDVLQYKHPDLVHRMCDYYGFSFEESESLFTHLKKWLWLCNESTFEEPSSSQRLFIDSPLIIIDEIWHNFILYTSDYHDFCQRYFGEFIHHTPTSHEEKQAYKQQAEHMSQQARLEELKDKKRALYSYIYEKLGEQNFREWYFIFPERYNKSNLIKKHIDKNFPEMDLKSNEA